MCFSTQFFFKLHPAGMVHWSSNLWVFFPNIDLADPGYNSRPGTNSTSHRFLANHSMTLEEQQSTCPCDTRVGFPLNKPCLLINDATWHQNISKIIHPMPKFLRMLWMSRFRKCRPDWHRLSCNEHTWVAHPKLDRWYSGITRLLVGRILRILWIFCKWYLRFVSASSIHLQVESLEIFPFTSIYLLWRYMSRTENV